MHGWKYTLQGTAMETRVGYQGLADFILNGNGDSFQRLQFDQISNNYIKEYIHGVWTDTTQFWTPWFRTTEGFRLDYVHGSVNSVANPLLALGSFPPFVPDPTGTFLVLATPFFWAASTMANSGGSSRARRSGPCSDPTTTPSCS